MTASSVLITGATGNLGQKLRRHLAGRYDLRLVCLNPDEDRAVATADLSRVDPGWTCLFEGVDVVIHGAAASKHDSDWPAVLRHNVDATLNVFEAAARAGVARVVFMSSNWTMAGYRFDARRLTTDLPPWPVNPYGVSKVIGERIGRSFAEHHGLSVICLRIGDCSAAPGRPSHPTARFGRWGQEMWLSERDFCQLVERAILAREIPFAIVNGMSDNPGMRWDLEGTRALLDYAPQDGRAVVPSLALHTRDLLARIVHGLRRFG